MIPLHNLKFSRKCLYKTRLISIFHIPNQVKILVLYLGKYGKFQCMNMKNEFISKLLYSRYEVAIKMRFSKLRLRTHLSSNHTK